MVPELQKRPSMGGTENGVRPQIYSYWRVGYGEPERFLHDFWVEQAGEYHCIPYLNYLIDSYEIERWMRVFYLKKGDAEWRAEGGVTQLTPGDILIIPPGYKGEYVTAEGHQYHWFAVVGKWPSVWGEMAKPQRLTLDFDREVENGFVGIRETLILQQSGYSLKALGYFYNIFSRVQQLQNKADPTVSRSEYPESVRKTIIFLEENFARPYSGNETAANVHLSSVHLRSLFERWVGLSPKRYHTQCRIEQAKRLLEQKTLAVQAVAIAVGFEDAAYFSRVFKQFAGDPPQKWQKRF
ncbi:MAG: helix-turn-helix domain-containing protein [Anaerolineae bacterium]